MEYKSLTPLTPEDVAAAIAKMPGWTGDENGLKRTVMFRSFRSALQFMQICAAGIDERDHHPVWCNKYKSLDMHLDTFDAGHRVTAKDVELAAFLNGKLDAMREQIEEETR